MLPQGSTEYGAGEGYKLTLRVFLWVSLTTTAMLMGIGALAALGQLRSSDAWTPAEALRHALQMAGDADPQTKGWTVHSLEWRPDRNEYVIVVLREGHPDGYSVTLNPLTRTVVRLAIADPQRLAPASAAIRIPEVQEKLRVLGYYNGEVDGKTGPLTTRALKQFQRNHNLGVTGEPDTVTLRRLMDYLPPR